MSRFKLLPWALGIALCAVPFLVGANRFLHPDPTTPGGGGPPGKQPANPPAGEVSLYVHGTVAAAQDPIPYGPSATLPIGQIVDVSIREGQEVKAGDTLYRFDDRMVVAQMKEAEMGLQTAIRQYNHAMKLKDTHAVELKRAQEAVTAATKQVELARRGIEAADALFEEKERPFLRDESSRPLPPEEVTRRKRNNPGIIEAEAKLAKAEAELADLKLQLELAQKNPVQEQIETAAAAANVAQAKLDHARLAVAECVVTAKVAGVVEQVAATPGMIVGPQTRTPLMWLIPHGPRVVRAEVVPEYAHRIAGRIGQRAVITDDTNTSLSYEGEVRRVASAFLPKRQAGADLLSAKPTLVLEVEIEIKDAAPPNMPPLRVGQPVRVSIGQ